MTQDDMGALFLADMVSEPRWNEALAASPGQLETLADEALAELERGETRSMDLELAFQDR